MSFARMKCFLIFTRPFTMNGLLNTRFGQSLCYHSFFQSLHYWTGATLDIERQILWIFLEASWILYGCTRFSVNSINLGSLSLLPAALKVPSQFNSLVTTGINHGLRSMSRSTWVSHNVRSRLMWITSAHAGLTGSLEASTSITSIIRCHACQDRTSDLSPTT